MAGRWRQQQPVCSANAQLVAALYQRARGQYSGQHMARTLVKAAGSVCKYPLAITCGQQATQLEHIGPAVADMIGGILRELASAAAAPSPIHSAASYNSASVRDGSSGATATPKKRRRKDADQLRVLSDAFARDSATPTDDALAQLAVASQCSEAYIRRFFADRRRKAAASAPVVAAGADLVPGAASAGTAAGVRAYFPKERTGNWAVLIALAENTVAQNDSVGGSAARTELLKSELIDFARPLCDASFDLPPPGTGGGGGYSAVPSGGGFHTAWSGVNKMLVGKGLVAVRSSPRLYSLTEAGWATVATLQARRSTSGAGVAGVAGAEKQVYGGAKQVASPVTAGHKSSHDRDGNGNVVAGQAAATSVPDSKAASLAKSGSRADKVDISSDGAVNNSAAMIERTVSVALAHMPSQSRGSVWPTDAADDPGWDLTLVLDNREVRTKKDRDYMFRALEAAGVRVVVRSLPLGDMMWVVTAANSSTAQEGGDPLPTADRVQQENENEEEYVCPYIVERKTAADLRASISDARYKEQKYRLADCGVSHVIYLIEGRLSLSDHDKKLRTAMISTQLHDSGIFKTKQQNELKRLSHGAVVADYHHGYTKTVDIAESVRWLAALTRHIQQAIGAGVRIELGLADDMDNTCSDTGAVDLATNARGSKAAVTAALRRLCSGAGTYSQFKDRAAKSAQMTVGELWAKQLVQIPKISAAGARVIHAAWPSPAALVEAYRSCEGGKQACVAMVEELKTIAPKSGAKRKLGKQPAENLHSVFMMERS